MEVLKEIASQCGFKVLTTRVCDGVYVYVFVSVSPKVGVSVRIS